MPNEALSAVKDMTMHLLALGVGVFALVGGYLSTQNHGNLRGRRWLLFSLLTFGFSLTAGLVVFSRLIELATHATAQKPIDLNDSIIRLASGAQIGTVFLGAILFFIYLCLNLWRRSP